MISREIGVNPEIKNICGPASLFGPKAVYHGLARGKKGKS